VKEGCKMKKLITTGIVLGALVGSQGMVLADSSLTRPAYVATDEKSTTMSVSSRLDTIIKRGYINVGTTGDYKPFTYLNPKTNEYEGYDIEAAKLLAKHLGVEVRFVKTTWPTLMEDLLANKFDIAMGGITRTFERQTKAHLSHPYLTFGKSPLIRKEDQQKYKSLADIDQPGVKIGVNPGGTNEKFVKENIKKAQVVVVEKNLEIPGMVASGKVDVMITDSVEAILYAKQDQRLYAALTDHPFTVSQMGYLMPRGDVIFENWINFWMEEMELQGSFVKLKNKWIEVDHK
jgi:cyclohexadienyl dehydratase